MSSGARRTDRRGFILATSLLVLTLLTVMLTAAFILVSAEFRTTDNAASSARALAMAEAGLENYLSLTRGLRPVDTNDSLRINFSGGYADVVARRLRAATGGGLSLWVVRSTGRPNDPLLTGTPASRRTIARVAELYPGILPGRAALTALNGVVITGTGGGYSGNPVNGANIAGAGNQGSCIDPGGGAAGDTVGISTPTGLYSQSGPAGQQWPGGEGTNGIEYFPSWSALYDSTHINWPMLVDTSASNFFPDYIIPGGSLPPYASSTYPVGLALGDMTIPPSNQGSGWYSAAGIRGILVVTGNLTMADKAHWDGVVVVGGRLIVQGQYVIHGMIITGMNRSLGMTVAADTLPRISSTPPGANPTHAIQWYYCYPKASADALSGLVPFHRVWTDGWALY